MISVFRRARSITPWPAVSTIVVSRATRRLASGQPRTTSPPNRVATVTSTPARPKRTSASCSTSSTRRDGSRTGPSTRCTYFHRNTRKTGNWTSEKCTTHAHATITSYPITISLYLFPVQRQHWFLCVDSILNFVYDNNNMFLYAPNITIRIHMSHIIVHARIACLLS